MILMCLSLALVSLAVSLPVANVLTRFSARWGLVDAAGPEDHKRHTRPIPNTGGIAIFFGVAGPMLACFAAAWVVPESWWSATLTGVGHHIDGLKRMAGSGVGLLAGMCVMHLLGLADDRRPLGPFVKLAAQIVVALGLVLVCDIRVWHFLDQSGWWATAIGITISTAWIVAIINAVNFLDNMDGLAASVAAVIAAVYLSSTLIGGQWFVAGLSALLLGALVGFGVFNLPPARLYMGDGGSLVVGLVLAVVSVRTTYFDSGAGAFARAGHWYGVLMPLMVMAIPLYDLTSVVLIRLAKGQSPFRGDANHFSHRLVRKGLGPRRAVLVICLCTAATGLSGVMLGSLDRWQALIAFSQTAAVLTVLAVMESGRSDRPE